MESCTKTPVNQPDCRACTKELVAERIEVAITALVEEMLALSDELKSEARLADLFEAIASLSSAAAADGAGTCDHCMRCDSIRGTYRVLPADRILALRRGETVEVPVRVMGAVLAKSVPPPYPVGAVLGALETWGRGWYHEERFYNDAEGHSRSSLEWTELEPDDEDDVPAIWYYADGEPPSDDSDYEWDKRPAVELPPDAVRVWFRVVEVERREVEYEDLWMLRCEPAARPENHPTP